ncbi:class C sortase [Ruminococcus sp.]|uniref:class C sortase n=1 Tax=Ruminococcus sp. TaxID=41978 RepID=UPI003866E7D8
MMWRKILTVVAIIILLTGIGFLLFPTVSNFIGQQRANDVIEEYSETLDHVIKEDDPETAKELGITAKSFEEALEKGEIDEEGYPVNSEGVRTYSYTVSFEYDLDRLYSDSKEYNASIFHHQGTVDTINYEKAALDMSRYGLNNLYGYLSAPSIDLYLPVYLGANDSMMSYGAAHLSGTSLPIDEKNTNVAIAGHTGYIGRIFFDNIKRLDLGDTVSFTNYWETIDYEVIDFKTVAPNETGDIYIKDGRQLMTLITCTPDGHGGFGRYLVICEKK